jgi:hypothetical protein
VPVGICWTTGGNATPTALNTAPAQPGACGGSRKCFESIRQAAGAAAIVDAGDRLLWSNYLRSLLGWPAGPIGSPSWCGCSAIRPVDDLRSD